jgi:hypothetical protein
MSDQALVKLCKEQNEIIQSGIEAAQSVVNSWESGDLAGAVRWLDIWLNEALVFQKSFAESVGAPKEQTPKSCCANEDRDTNGDPCL